MLLKQTDCNVQNRQTIEAQVEAFLANGRKIFRPGTTESVSTNLENPFANADPGRRKPRISEVERAGINPGETLLAEVEEAMRKRGTTLGKWETAMKTGNCRCRGALRGLTKGKKSLALIKQALDWIAATPVSISL